MQFCQLLLIIKFYKNNKINEMRQNKALNVVDIFLINLYRIYINRDDNCFISFS